MADFSVTPIATQIKPPEGISLGDMLNLARGAQAYQQSQQANPLELQRLRAEANVAAQTEAPRISSAQSLAKTQETGAQSADFDLQNKRINGIASRLTGLINDPLIVASEQNPQAVDKTKIAERLKAYGYQQAKELGISLDKADELIAPYITEADANHAGIRQFLKNKLLSTLDQGSRVTAMQPSGVAINTGAGGGTVQTGEFGALPIGKPIPGTVYEQQIPPTQPVISSTGETRLLGPMSQRGNTPLTTGLSPAQSGMLTAGGQVISSDLATTTADAQAAPTKIAIFQNIKKLTPDSFTGPTAERRQWAASLAQVIGIPVAELETASTDELLKNTKLLQMAGGNTDAARSLAEFANPNNKMTKEGILRVTNQLIGMENMKIARNNYLTPAANDATEYAKRKLQFDAISDPRLFQEVTAEDVAKMKKTMSQAEQAELSRKIKVARQLGVLK
ncbi:hypothetical protein UFOVP188_38 [uncultured Caudovirales phage]|uniref:Uncharacterized protein n=1 Tax=uncultured Caudovirales phage TaxID=2100421 RepID=A0A6J7WMP3_9CAUD|nr:hypothetical protein UFOVP188_38 [uncultured Caudovirales phage]